MSAEVEVIRRAIVLMRSRAEAATDGGPRWETAPDEMHGPSRSVIYPADSDSAVAFAGSDDAEHIAAWHPAVALAVADWLEHQAVADEFHERQDADNEFADGYTPRAGTIRALVVAKAYFGEDPA